MLLKERFDCLALEVGWYGITLNIDTFYIHPKVRGIFTSNVERPGRVVVDTSGNIAIHTDMVCYRNGQKD